MYVHNRENFFKIFGKSKHTGRYCVLLVFAITALFLIGCAPEPKKPEQANKQDNYHGTASATAPKVTETSPKAPKIAPKSTAIPDTSTSPEKDTTSTIPKTASKKGTVNPIAIPDISPNCTKNHGRRGYYPHCTISGRRS